MLPSPPQHSGRSATSLSASCRTRLRAAKMLRYPLEAKNVRGVPLMLSYCLVSLVLALIGKLAGIGSGLEAIDVMDRSAVLAKGRGGGGGTDKACEVSCRAGSVQEEAVSSESGHALELAGLRVGFTQPTSPSHQVFLWHWKPLILSEHAIPVPIPFEVVRCVKSPTQKAYATVLEVFVETEDVAAALEESVGMSPGSVPCLTLEHHYVCGIRQSGRCRNLQSIS